MSNYGKLSAQIHVGRSRPIGMVALHIIVSRDVPLLKSDFFSQSDFFVDHSMNIFRAEEKCNPVIFVLALENILGPSAVTYFDRNSITYNHRYSQGTLL